MTQTGVERRRIETTTEHFDTIAGDRERWIAKSEYFYDDELAFLRFVIPPDRNVLEIGCGTGRLVSLLNPRRGVGVDMSPAMIDEARRRHPHAEFLVGNIESSETIAEISGPFDNILAIDVVGYLSDIQGTFEKVRSLCTPDTRVVVGYFGQAWRPALRLASRLGLRMPEPPDGNNFVSSDELSRILELAGFEVVRREWRMLIPRRLFGAGPFLNAIAGTLPGLRRASLRNYLVARPVPCPTMEDPSVTVVVPCRNEAGNIAAAVERLPQMASKQEILFVEGHSSDDTWETIKAVAAAHPDKDITSYQQTGKGKGDAVRLAFEKAKGDILIILDADLTVAPEDIPKFYAVIRDGRADFVNGSRLVYPLGEDAMRRLNAIANHLFARLFSWLLNQNLTDTLCGTKAITREQYDLIAENRSYFGEFDPFGDFDLLFGASRLGLKIVEVPVRYSGREYGEPQISRFSDGAMLARMVAFAWRKMKVVG